MCIIVKEEDLKYTNPVENSIIKKELSFDDSYIVKDECTLSESMATSSNMCSRIKEEFVDCGSAFDSSDTHTIIKEEIFVEEPHQEHLEYEVFPRKKQYT